MKKLALLLILPLAVVLAQNREQEKARLELERTDEVIRRVQPLVENAGVPEATALLNEGIRIQEQAREAYRGNRFRMALGYTLNARGKARDAAAMVEIEPERVQAEIRRTAELMAEFGPVVRRADLPRANELWRMAETELGTARDEFNGRRFRFALKFALAARMHAREAFELCRGQADPERIRVELDRTQALIDRVSEPVKASGNELANQLLSRAVGLQEQANNALRNRQSLQALRLTFAGRELAWRAWNMVRSRLGPEPVEQALAQTDALIADWNDRFGAGDETPARNLFQQALSLQANARQRFAAREYKPALSLTTRARRLVQRAIDLLETGTGDN